jgi:hypothetical protein
MHPFTTLLIYSLYASSFHMDDSTVSHGLPTALPMAPAQDVWARVMHRPTADRYAGRLLLASTDPGNEGAEVQPVPAGRPDCGESAPRRVFKAAYAQCGLNGEMLPNRGEFSCWLVPKMDHTGCVEQCTFVGCAPP